MPELWQHTWRGPFFFTMEKLQNCTCLQLAHEPCDSCKYHEDFKFSIANLQECKHVLVLWLCMVIAFNRGDWGYLYTHFAFTIYKEPSTASRTWWHVEDCWNIQRLLWTLRRGFCFGNDVTSCHGGKHLNRSVHMGSINEIRPTYPPLFDAFWNHTPCAGKVGKVGENF